MGGHKLQSQLAKSDPWSDNPCDKEDCFVCKGEKGGKCRKKNAGYKIICKACGAEYHGETSRTLYCRGTEHLKGLNTKSKDSVLWAHCATEHNGTMVQFTMEATGYFQEPLTRQINEAVRIYHSSRIMNRKGEWKKTAVPRANYTRI